MRKRIGRGARQFDAAAITFGAILSACGGDDDGADGPSGSDAPRLSDQLRRLGEDWGAVEARVTYDLTAEGQGFAAEGTLTFYSLPPDRVRVDQAIGDEPPGIVIETSERSLVCGTVAGEGSCAAGPPGAALNSLFPFFSGFADPDTIEENFRDADDFVDLTRFEDEIAGEDAACFRATGAFYSEETGEATWCFAENGALLLASFAGPESGELRLTATDLEGVSEDDFDPPYPVLEIGDLFSE